MRSIHGYIEEDKKTASRCSYKGEQTYCYSCVSILLKLALCKLEKSQIQMANM